MGAGGGPIIANVADRFVYGVALHEVLKPWTAWEGDKHVEQSRGPRAGGDGSWNDYYG